VVTVEGSQDGSVTADWMTGKGLEGFISLGDQEPNVELLSDPRTFSVTQRVASYGPVVVAQIGTDTDMDISCGTLRSTYRVNIARSGCVESRHRGSSLAAGTDTAVLYQPEGDASSRWAAGSRILSLRIDRCVVEDALSASVGRQLTSQIDFTSCVSVRSPASRSWISMVSLFVDQIFRVDSVLSQPMVGLPFVDGLVHGLLLVADHPYRDVVTGRTPAVSSRAIRTAIELIEAEAHLPLTVSSIAARCYVSVRSLQEDFRRQLGTSPMAFLREVRLRRAHQCLVESDPSTTSVSEVAHQWGFTNLGRFAAAHAAQFDEHPVVTLRRRTTSRRTQPTAR
jgi:AraC-like DNA-binding protein